MAVERTIHLYPYQADMVNRIEKAFESFRSVMVQMPTGTGKTHVIAVIARKFVSEGKTVRMVAHRRELVTQIRNTLALYMSKDEMSLVEGEWSPGFEQHVFWGPLYAVRPFGPRPQQGETHRHIHTLISFTQCRGGLHALPQKMSQPIWKITTDLIYHKSDEGIKAHLHLAILAYCVVSMQDTCCAREASSRNGGRCDLLWTSR